MGRVHLGNTTNIGVRQMKDRDTWYEKGAWTELRQGSIHAKKTCHCI
jgi:hypothetical protein